MAVLNRFLRVLVGTGDDREVVGAAVPVRLQSALEETVTAVAEIVSAQESPALVTNTRVRLDVIDRSSNPEDGYQVGPLFQGTLDKIGGVSVPHSATFRAKGPLARTRRSFDVDKNLTGKTDEEAVSYVLTQCGVSHDDANIGGMGYVLGAIEPVIWKAGQSGAEVIAELDRVFACATIEVGAGVIVRFAYSRCPDLYDDPPIAASYRRGQAGVNFYEHERDRGDIDQIQNYWRVNGLGWSGDEGTADEGCRFQIWASGKADHAKLGAGVYVGPESFESDMLQSEARAKATAKRLMQWWNREPDTIRIAAPLDAAVIVGSLVSVRDAVYGIDLSSAKTYLVLLKTIEGDLMTLDGIGGTTGATGTLTSGIDRCCGTQQADGTCSDIGTNPGPDGVPDPSVPGGPDGELCDPLTDPLCVLLPGGGGVTTPPNTTDPFVDCTDSGELVDAISHPWYEAGDIGYRYDADTGETLGVNTLSNGVLVHNETVGAKTFENSVQYGTGETVCVSGTLVFPCTPGEIGHPHLTIELTPDSGIASRITFYADPGYEPMTGYWRGVDAGSEHEAAIFSPVRVPGVCYPPIGGISNNGGAEGMPVPVGAETPFSVCFDIGSSPQRTYFSYSGGSGFMEDVTWRCGVGPTFTPPDPCAHGSHTLRIELAGSLVTTADASCPWVELRDLSIGAGTCTPNPDYVEPDRSGGRG